MLRVALALKKPRKKEAYPPGYRGGNFVAKK
jgi:hypothetical protein